MMTVTLTLDLNGRRITLSEAEAREVYSKLAELLGPRQEILPMPYPVPTPYPCPRSPIWWTDTDTAVNPRNWDTITIADGYRATETVPSIWTITLYEAVGAGRSI